MSYNITSSDSNSFEYLFTLLLLLLDIRYMLKLK